MTLRRKRALVTGASGGIGGAIARQLARAEYEVLLSGRREERLRDLTASIEESGGVARYLGSDLTTEEGIDRLARAVGEAPLDLLVHSLGVFHLGPVEDTPVEILDRQLAVNLRAPWALTRRLDPARCGLRDLVFVSSTAAKGARAGAAAYTASKAALGVLAETLREELAPLGCRVLTLFPGRTATEMQAEVRAAEGAPYQAEHWMQPDDVAAMVLAAVTLPRSAEVTEIVLRHRRPGAPR